MALINNKNQNNTKEQERAELHRAIWQIANDLRGSVDGWDFKSYVLGMLFYRFISENLTSYINTDERRSGKKDFDYAELTDNEAEFGRFDTVKEKGFYMGILSSERYPEEVEGKHTAMISEQMFYKVQAILDGRNQNKFPLTHRVRENPAFPLRRLAKCGRCGAAFTGYWGKGNGGKYAYYRCSKFCTGQSVRVEVMDEELIKLLRSITPIKEGLELFISYIQKHYYKRLARLQNVRNDSDSEIAKLQELRQQLVEKNLSGVFSDEIFKEQNRRIEDQIFKAHIAKHDETFDKYDVNKITDFVRTLLADLGETYKKSDLGQKKMLIGSIYPSGLAWGYPGYSNHEVGALYQSIRDACDGSTPLGDPYASLFEPIVSYLYSMMQYYRDENDSITLKSSN